MEILHRGVAPAERKYVGRCSTCTTRVRFMEGEAQRSRDQREPGVYVSCPVCSGMIWGTREN